MDYYFRILYVDFLTKRVFMRPKQMDKNKFEFRDYLIIGFDDSGKLYTGCTLKIEI